MDRKALIILLVKLFPLYAIILILWQFMGLGRVYHAAVCIPVGWIFSIFDSNGPFEGAGASGRDLLIKLLVGGRHLRLALVAGDITSNTSMLLALYLASPIRSNYKRFFIYFLASIITLFIIHAFTIAMTAKYAFLTKPEIVKLFPPGKAALKLIPIYKNFYEIIGMYLFVLALWLPYIFSVIISRDGRAQAS